GAIAHQFAERAEDARIGHVAVLQKGQLASEQRRRAASVPLQPAMEAAAPETRAQHLARRFRLDLSRALCQRAMPLPTQRSATATPGTPPPTRFTASSAPAIGNVSGPFVWPDEYVPHLAAAVAVTEGRRPAASELLYQRAKYAAAVMMASPE